MTPKMITDGARTMQIVACNVAGSIAAVEATSQDLADRARALARQASTLMERIRNADRVAEPLSRCGSEVELTVDSISLTGRLQNVSAGGVALRADATQLPANPRSVRLRIPNAPVNAAMRIVAADLSLVDLAFLDATEGETALRWFTTAQAKPTAS